jgi:uncharacterized protein YeaO (DUF488 family)
MDGSPQGARVARPGGGGKLTMVKTKRVYESAAAADGVRFLVERLWPRGMKKAAVKIDGWLRDAAPSTALRKWFGHDPKRWREFRKRYFRELAAHPAGSAPIVEAARRKTVTLLYSAHDTEHNSALVLKEFLERRLEGRPAARAKARTRPARRARAAAAKKR